MDDLLGGDKNYDPRHLRSKLKSKYGNRIVFSQLSGKDVIFSFRHTAE